ncbi:MAG TPA: hypothetical protein VLM75_03410 [Spirochaetota bacterium]|nr:hypothetical protein [Spirochaetota bacterium]
MLRYALFVIVAVILATAAKELFDTVKFGREGLDLYNVREDTDSNKRRFFAVADLSYRHAGIPSTTDLVLSFNRPAPEMVKDDSGQYIIRRAGFETMLGAGTLGGAGAYFFKTGHRVEIRPERNLWLGGCADAGSFTIEMRLQPASLSDGAVLFSSVGYASGLKQGVEIVLKGKRVVARLHRFFRDAAGRRVDVFLNRARPFSEGEWRHYALSFDRVSGKLASLVDGEEQEVVYLSDNGEPFVNVYEPSFACEDLPVVVVGKNYFGAIDELRVSYRHIDDLKKVTELAIKSYGAIGAIGRTPVNREGVVTSPVYNFPGTGTRVLLFKWEELVKNNTHIWMEFRTSDDLFDRNGEAPRWYRIGNNQRNISLKKTDGLYLRGRYYQWRAHLLASPDGAHSPRLYGAEIQYQLDPAPRPPIMVGVVKTGDAVVRLRWRKNVEHDILGYRIYYGTSPGKYDGIIAMAGGRRIDNALAAGRNHIEIDVTNELIQENMALDPRKLLAFPILKNNVLYFFAVSAYDSYRPDTPHRHESEPSKEISARPSAGSEITN